MIIKYLTILFGIFAFSIVSCRADEKDLARRALFTVKVEGIGKDNKQIIPRKGRAFAVTENVLITAAHVTGRRDEFSLRYDDDLNIPYRKVVIETVLKYGDPPDTKRPTKLYVTPAPIETVDAAKLTVPEFTAEPFNLSACTIEKQKKYFALILRDGNLGMPEFLHLTPDKYSSTNYGEIYVFENDDYPSKMIVNGDSGSPVLNEDNEVVGLVSARKGEGKRVLVTLVKSFIDLIPPDVKEPVNCDLRVTAKKIEFIQTVLKDAQERLIDANLRASLALQVILEKSDLSPDQMREKLKDLKDEESIYVMIKRWEKDLGTELWSLTTRNEQGVTEIALKYQRQISRQKFSNIAYLCFEPLAEIKDQTLTSSPDDVSYYRNLDKNAEESPDKCDRSKHFEPNEITKSGSYTFSHSKSSVRREMAKRKGWDGRYYVQFVAEIDKDRHNVVRRYLLKFNEKGGFTNCRYFSSRRDIAAHVGATTKKTPEIFREITKRETRRQVKVSNVVSKQTGFACAEPL